MQVSPRYFFFINVSHMKYLQKNILLTPCLAPSPTPRQGESATSARWTLSLRQKKIKKIKVCQIKWMWYRNREVHGSLWVTSCHPSRNTPQCGKSKIMTNSTCGGWWTEKKKLKNKTKPKQTKQNLFVCYNSSSHFIICHQWFIG